MCSDSLASARPKTGSTRRRHDPEHAVVAGPGRATPVAAISGVEGRSYEGRSVFRDYIREMDEVWAAREARVERVEDIDAERVLVVGVFSARSERGGVPVEFRFANVMTVREGKVVRTESHASVEGALEAVGLRE